jgi:chromosome segregation ATPase
MLAAKGRGTLEVLQERLATFLAQHERVQGERAALAERLSSTLRAYEEALQQLRRYEQERVEMRVRLERILSWIDPGVPSGG